MSSSLILFPLSKYYEIFCEKISGYVDTDKLFTFGYTFILSFEFD